MREPYLAGTQKENKDGPVALMILLNVILNALASFLLKVGMQNLMKAEQAGILTLIMGMFKSLYIWSGGFCFAAGFFVYLLILRTMPLRVAYPFVTSGSLVLISILSFLVLKEPVSSINLLGMALILSGIALIMR